MRPEQAPSSSAWRSEPSCAGLGVPQQEDVLVAARRRGRDGRRGVLQQADRADDRRRVDRPARVLVVQRDVPRDDRSLERLAGLGHALDRLVQVVGGAGRSGLPKFRQLVIASGSAPAQATFRTAWATASQPPRRGSRATRAPSPSRPRRPRARSG